MKNLKNSLSMLLVLLLIILIIPMSSIEASAEGIDVATFNSKLATFKKEKYPNNSTYVDNPSLTGGYQCFGFANELALYIFGSYPTASMSAATINSGWERAYGGNAVDKLCVGDIVRYHFHSIFITNISGEKIYYCQANIPDGSNKVTYDNYISRSDLKAKVSDKLTSGGTDKLGWVAHYKNSQISSAINTLSIKYDANGGEIANSDKTYNEYTVVNTSSLNLRSGAGTSYERVAGIPKNATFVVTETATANGYTWGKTTYDEKSGWCVISEDWTTKTGTQPQTTYYLNSSGLVYKHSTKTVFMQKMEEGTTYDDGLRNCSTLGITRTGYKFKGWGTTSSGGTIFSSTEAMAPEDIDSSISNGDKTITLYAIWTPNVLTVSYNANGGALDSDSYKLNNKLVYRTKDSSKVTQDWTYNLPIENGLWNATTFGLSRTGYTFGGWGTSSSGGTIFDSNDTGLLPTEINSKIKNGNCSTTVYAVWNPNVLTVSYNANGGTLDSNTYKLSNNLIYRTKDNSKVTQDWTYNLPIENGLWNATTFGLSRVGYTFGGWATSSTGGTIFDSNDTGLLPFEINSNIEKGNCSTTVYAVWSANTYTIKYDANGGKGTTINSVHTYNTAKVLTTNGFTRAGYNFVGWSTDSSATIPTYTNGQSVKNLTIKKGETITLYAVWEPISYKIKYNANGGTGVMVDTTHTYDNEQPLSTNKFTRSGYIFTGWSTTSTAIVPAYIDNGLVKNLTTKDDSTVILYAVWEEISVAEHIYSDWVIEEESTCENTGRAKRVCSTCGEIETREIAAIGHDFINEYTVDKQPTCTEEGSKSQHCSRCDSKTNEVIISAIGHSYSDWVTTTPTCTTKGKEEHSCLICGYSETIEITALGHDYTTEYIIDVEATCSTEGSKSQHCSRCDNKINITTIPATSHDYTEWKVSIEPTCTNRGEEYHYCNNCGDEEQRFSSALGHNYGDFIFDIEPTCTTDGSKARFCSRCDSKVNIMVIPSTGHTSSDWTIDEDPTCTTYGSKHKECTICGEVLETESINPTGHSYSEWFVMEEPTCDTPGFEERGCLNPNCEFHEDRDIEVLGHDYADEYTVDKQPTHTSAGSKSRHCSRCDAKTDVTTIEKLYYKSKTYTGLYKVNGVWRYVKNGELDNSFTGLCKYNGKWYYVVDGEVDFTYTGLAKRSGKWYYVKKGVVDFSYTGLAKYSGKWYYVEDGVKDSSYTGLCKYGKSWYYVKKGVVDFTYTGLCKYSGKWYYVNKGVVNFNYTGLCKYSGKWYYVNKGKVDFTYTGNVKYNGKTYKVVKGIKV